MFGGIPAELIMEIAKSEGIYTQLELDLECPEWFFINPKYLKDEYNGWSRCSSKGISSSLTRYDYHPAFKTLRNILQKENFIKTEEWHNSDKVLKPFYLNNYLLVEGDSFLSPSAMKNQKQLTENYNNGKIIEGLKNYR